MTRHSNHPFSPFTHPKDKTFRVHVAGGEPTGSPLPRQGTIALLTDDSCQTWDSEYKGNSDPCVRPNFLFLFKFVLGWNLWSSTTNKRTNQKTYQSFRTPRVTPTTDSLLGPLPQNP